MSDYTGTIWPSRAPEPSQADVYAHHMGTYPNPDIDVAMAPELVNPGCPIMPEHPPYTPPALTMSRLYHIQMDLANGVQVPRQDQQALITEIYRLRSEAK